MANLRTAAKKASAAFPPLRHAVHLGERLVARSGSEIGTGYSTELPTQAVAFDIFRNQWSSVIPGLGLGTTGLFEDPRIQWLKEQLGSFQGKRVLELGSLEGGHTSMMEKDGATVIAIEANRRAFLKSLVVKNAFHLRAEFLLGDFRPYLAAAQPGAFDYISAIGVLYHMIEPLKLLHDMARVSNAFGVWTHFYDHSVMASKKHFDRKPVIQTLDGQSVEGHRQHYLRSTHLPTFCGGTAPTSVWLTKDGILDYVKSRGFEVSVNHVDMNHPAGPCLLFFARRASTKEK